ncbi:TIGR01620 family protein [Pleionea sp. CnH1-48]|uniref:TIGR01620 family protein n=1 Tax=Pleionea sp. CnH1-48 TaxID=2954494 RepID=UPI002097B276|nr:TIGR01620 family protein [Pleionea sp. CnH1-48]MCO7225435.1 TIGR01620 family protein [Pleionea sp. CnH1-48]
MTKIKPGQFKADEIKVQTEQVETQTVLPEKAMRVSSEHLVEIDAEPELSETDKDDTKLPTLLGWGVSLVGLLAILQLIDVTLSAYNISPYLGGIATLINVGLLGFGGRWLARIWGKKKKNRRRQALKSQLQALNTPQSHGQAIAKISELHANMAHQAANKELAQFRQQSHICQDDSEMIQLYSSVVLKGMDQKAKRIVARYSSESALMIALSPFAALDMVLVLWRSIKMVDEVSKVYGMHNAPFEKTRMVRDILRNMMLAGATELALDLGLEALGAKLSAKISARVAQGLGAGVASLRVGLKAMEYCRPVTFDKDEAPKISELKKDVIEEVKNRLLTSTSGSKED